MSHPHDIWNHTIKINFPNRIWSIFGNDTEQDPIRVVFTDGEDPPSNLIELVNSSKNNSVKLERINAIKRKANNLIIKTFPDFKQRNMLAEAITLQGIKLTTGLNETQQQRELFLTNVWTWISQVRIYSNTLEQKVLDNEEYSLNEGWPIFEEMQ
jgi:hypothetical protein